jgi:ABC-type uncharacterized transport system substrate-binding protein
MWRRLPALAGLLCLAGPAAAHPHGRIDCQAQVDAGPAGLQSIALQLTLDAQSSAALVPRLQFDGQGRLAADKPVRQFADLVAGMFRQGGWMLKLQALGADGEATGPSLDLADPAPAQFSRHADGQVVVAVQLKPEAPAASVHGWKLACLDPTWYWATGFAGAAQFTVNAPCRADLEAMRSMADQAQALQAAAVRAGVVGADQAAPGLLTAAGVRAPSGSIRCPAP